MRAVQRQPISLLDSWPTPDTDAVHQALREEQSRLFMHNIRFSFVLSRQAVRLPCSQSPG